MKVLLSAYACEPNKGGEPGIGWHWVVETARLGHTVWVITRANNRAAIERVSLSMPNLHFVYHDLPPWVTTLKKKGPFLAWYYALWQRSAYQRARMLHREQRFDIVQHVTFGVFRQSSLMGRLGIPFVFGPVGGGERAPLRLRMDYGVRGHLLDLVRDAANVAARWNPWLHTTFRTARLILVKTPHTGRVLPDRYHHKVRHIIEIGAPRAVDSPRVPGGDRGLRFLFVGRFLFWKGMQYGLKAFARHLQAVPGARLTMVGAGPDGPRWRRLCHTLGIADAVEWHDWIHHAEIGAVYRAHDVFVFPSLHDSSGSVVLEAMSFGLPVVCFDLGGPGVLVTETSGIVVPTANMNHEQLVAALADSMNELAGHADRLRELQRGALARARQLTWAFAVSHVYGAAAQSHLPWSAEPGVPARS